MYNDLTDYGLSFGTYDMRAFVTKVARFLYGNMGRANRYNIDGRMNGYTYFRNYTPDKNDANKTWDNRSTYSLYDDLMLRRLHEVRVFSDYSPRTEAAPASLDSRNADITVELVPFADGGMQPTFRDRHIILHGIDEHADFYCPDYSGRTPDAPDVYRRTLYWNPNAATDGSGTFRATFFNSGNTARLKVSVAGIMADGRLGVVGGL